MPSNSELPLFSMPSPILCWRSDTSRKLPRMQMEKYPRSHNDFGCKGNHQSQGFTKYRTRKKKLPLEDQNQCGRRPSEFDSKRIPNCIRFIEKKIYQITLIQKTNTKTNTKKLKWNKNCFCFLFFVFVLFLFLFF